MDQIPTDTAGFANRTNRELAEKLGEWLKIDPRWKGVDPRRLLGKHPSGFPSGAKAPPT